MACQGRCRGVQLSGGVEDEGEGHRPHQRMLGAELELLVIAVNSI